MTTPRGEEKKKKTRKGEEKIKMQGHDDDRSQNKKNTESDTEGRLED